MPYRSRYPKYAKSRRRRSATTLQRAWRRSKAPPKKSAVVRQTEANRVAIKSLKKHIEIKRADATVCTVDTNWCGQIIPKSIPVDNYGMSQTSQEYVALAASTPNQYLANKKYNPLWQMPIVVTQGDGEHQRVGNDITMRSLTIKGQMQGGFSSQNDGMYENISVPQTLHMYVILDTAPVPENTTIAGAGPYVWDFPSMAGQTFSFANNWNPLLPGGFAIPQVRNLQPLKNLVEGTANPPGLAANRASKDLLNLSYWSTDESGIGKDKRYRMIKHFKYQCNQHPPAPTVTTSILPSGSRKFTRDFSETITLPYKFTFKSDRNVVPDNQQLFLVFVSETPTCRNSGVVPPQDFVDPPSVLTHCRLNFTSA